MKFASLIAITAILSAGAEASFFKNLFGAKQPKKSSDLSVPNDSLKTDLVEVIDEWSGRIKKPSGKDTTKKSIARIKYYDSYSVGRNRFSPIYAKKGKKFYGGVTVELDCPKKDKISKKLVKSTLKKSVKKQQLYTIRCGGDVETGRVR